MHGEPVEADCGGEPGSVAGGLGRGTLDLKLGLAQSSEIGCLMLKKLVLKKPVLKEGGEDNRPGGPAW